MKIGSYILQDPIYLTVLLLVPIYFAYHFLFAAKRNAKVSSSSNEAIPNSAGALLHIAPILFGLSIIPLSIALSRPQLASDSDSYVEQFAEGIDIIIAMDVSGSMKEEDFKPNRLEVSKSVAQEFIRMRKNDRIGLVVYEAESFTQCPLTTDKEVLISLFEQIETGLMEPGTAIGTGLATAVNRLRESEASSKVVILLTDGVNNKGQIHPLAAAEIAQEFGVRVYTIGVGTNGSIKKPVGRNLIGDIIYEDVPVEIDEEILTQISDKTNGKYFRATDKSSLESIYSEIDAMEKEIIKTIEYQVDLPEEFKPFMYVALIMIAIGIVLQQIIFRTTY